MDRTIAIHAVMATLDEALDAVERTAAMARDEVASEETKPEGKYDTRATEASYLARGQAWRVAALRRLRAWFDTLDPNRAPEVVTVGSLVSLSGPRAGWVFVALQLSAPSDGITLTASVTDGDASTLEVANAMHIPASFGGITLPFTPEAEGTWEVTLSAPGYAPVVFTVTTAADE